MANNDVEITPIDLRTAEKDWLPFSDCLNRLHSECHPDDPPASIEENVGSWRNSWPDSRPNVWVARRRNGDEIVAWASIPIVLTGESRYKACFGIEILPAYRRQGLGRKLLACVADTAVRESVRELLAVSLGCIPAGSVFLERMGARLQSEHHVNQLDIAELNRSVLSEWRGLSDDFEVEFHSGAFSPKQSERLIGLTDAIFVRKSDSAEERDSVEQAKTLSYFQQEENTYFVRGRERWAAFLRKRATGEYADCCVVKWNPENEAVVIQWDTGILHEYRRRGLAKFLKAAMIDKILLEYPNVRFVRTTNRSRNEPILKINHAMGFRSIISEFRWTIETEQILRYLQSC